MKMYLHNKHFVFLPLTLFVGLGLALSLPWLAKAHGFNAKSDAGIPDNAPEAIKLYVDISGTGGDGSSWNAAFNTLQDALAVTSDPTIRPIEIWVAKGVYYPDVGNGQINNDQNSTFVMTDGVELYGGFLNGDTSITDRDPQNNITVLSGDIDWDNGGIDITDANGVVITTTDIISDNAYHVVTARGVTGTAVLDGFTITAGKASGHGGGYYCDGSGINNVCSPRLNNVDFSGNSASHGGAMYNDGSPNGKSSPSLTSVTFSGNSANRGGAIYNDGSSTGESSPSLTNVTFSGNWAGQYGGAMYNDGQSFGSSSPTMTNVIFAGNWSEVGGAMYNHCDGFGSCSPTMTNVTFSSNSAKISGGAIRTFIGVNGNSIPTVYNSILWGNQANGVTGTIYVNINIDIAYIKLTHSLVEGAYAGGSWVGGRYIDGGGNIDEDPVFIDPISPSSAPTTTGILRLGQGSPAIDAGLNLHTENTGILTDLDGEARFKDGDGDGDADVDMGAYEYQPMHLLTVNITGTGDGKVTSSPAGIDCGGTCSDYFEEGTAVTLTAVADEGSIFNGWDGACSGEGDCQLTMDAAKDVTVVFDLEPAFKINLPTIFR